MATYTVNPAQVAGTVAEIEAASQRILAMLQNLQTQLQANLAEWQTPEAKAAYDRAELTWREAAREMPLLLTVMRDTLDNTINDYAMAERAGSDLFAGR